jgi:hypothetical protein
MVQYSLRRGTVLELDASTKSGLQNLGAGYRNAAIDWAIEYILSNILKKILSQCR